MCGSDPLFGYLVRAFTNRHNEPLENFGLKDGIDDFAALGLQNWGLHGMWVATGQHFLPHREAP